MNEVVAAYLKLGRQWLLCTCKNSTFLVPLRASCCSKTEVLHFFLHNHPFDWLIIFLPPAKRSLQWVSPADCVILNLLGDDVTFLCRCMESCFDSVLMNSSFGSSGNWAMRCCFCLGVSIPGTHSFREHKSDHSYIGSKASAKKWGYVS